MNMITEEIYVSYFKSLLEGDRKACADVVKSLLNKDINIVDLYVELFQRSLYQVGKLWECNKITVAREHLVTNITEFLMNLVYPRLFSGDTSESTVIVSCTANEYHQIGGKMVADIMELYGWNAHFLGANIPINDLLKHIDEIRPKLVGLSLSVIIHMPALKRSIEAIQNNFSHIHIIVGGQAFNWGVEWAFKNNSQVEYLSSLDDLKKLG